MRMTLELQIERVIDKVVASIPFLISDGIPVPDYIRGKMPWHVSCLIFPISLINFFDPILKNLSEWCDGFFKTFKSGFF